MNSYKNIDELAADRLAICNTCLLCLKLNPDYWICNPYIYVNFETGEVSKTKKQGFVTGCGCNCYRKAFSISGRCPNNKWKK